MSVSRAFGVLPLILAAAACDDRTYRDIGTEIGIVAKRTDSLVAPARERLLSFGRRAIPQIETALHTASESGKLNLIGVLESLGDEESIPILRQIAIHDRSVQVRAACETILRGWSVGETRRAQAARLARARVAAQNGVGEK